MIRGTRTFSSPPLAAIVRGTAIVVLVASCAACGSPAGQHVEPVEVLFRDVAVASKHWPGILVEFGAPAALPALGEGWSYGETASDGNPFRWAVGEKATFRFESPQAEDRLGWIECEPYRFAGAPTQAVEILLNGRALPTLRLREGRSRYPLELSLVRGLNEVELHFAYARAPIEAASSGDRRPLAAAFYRFDVPPDGSQRLAPEAGPFSIVTPVDGRPGVVVPRGGRLDFFIDVPEKARLSVRAGAERPEKLLAPRGARLHVRVESEAGDVVTETLTASAARGEVLSREISLAGMVGQRARLSFAAEGFDLLVSPFLAGVERRVVPAKPYELAPDSANLLVVVLDGAAASRMSAYGYPKPTTPNVRRLVEQSVVFQNAVSQAVYTIASIGSVLTGQYPERHQSVSFADRLPATAATFPGILTLEGFHTAGFSGNAVVSSTFGLDRGYERFYPAWELDDYTGHGDSVLRPFFAWLDEHRADRFLAYIHFREPHFPYNPPPPFDTRFGNPAPYGSGIVDWEEVETLNRAAAHGEDVPQEKIRAIRTLYEGNMAYADSLVGKILDRLKALDLTGKTVIFLTADHGEALFEHRFIGHNTQLYEESVRVPLVVFIPGQPPRTVSQAVQLIDVAPTILDLVGLGGEPAVERMQGRTLVPLLAGDTLPERLAFSRTLWNKPRYAARDGHHKLIWDSRTGATELYDLDSDPHEAHDRFDAGDVDVAGGYLRERLYGWLRRQEQLRAGAPVPEHVAVPEDLGRYLGGIGYLQYLEKKEEEPRD